MRVYYPRLEWDYHVVTQSYRCYLITEEMARGGELDAPICVIPREAYDELKDWMADNDPHGVIRTDRKEDLKIIHRLLDVQEKMVK